MKILQRAALVSAILLATGCVSNTISSNGAVQGEVKWASLADAKKSTFPTTGELFNLKKGVDKEAIYALIGEPHFSEGFRVNEWNYLFKFHKNNGIKTCQYKVVFDSNGIAQNFFWLPSNCLNSTPKKEKKISINTDALFPLNKFAIDAIKPQAKHDLDTLAKHLKSYSGIKIKISGHTDRIGKESYNLTLSEKRAYAIAQYVANKGVSSDMEVQGLGESHPIVNCKGRLSKKLIKCLSPNRRVDIVISNK